MRGLKIMDKQSDIQQIKFNEAFEIKINKVVKKTYEKLKDSSYFSAYYIDEVTSGSPDLEENFISVQGTRTPLKEEEIPNVKEREIITVEIVQPEEMDGSFVDDGRILSNQDQYEKNLDYIKLLEDKNPYTPKKKKDKLVEEVDEPLEPEIVEKTEENTGPLLIDEMIRSELKKSLILAEAESASGIKVALHDTLESAEQSRNRIKEYAFQGTKTKLKPSEEEILLDPDTNKYECNVSTAWCGHFIAFCYKDIFTDTFRQKFLKSNYKLFFEFVVGRKKNFIYFDKFLKKLRKEFEVELLRIENALPTTPEQKLQELNAFFEEKRLAFLEEFPVGCILSCLHRNNPNHPYGKHFGILEDMLIELVDVPGDSEAKDIQISLKVYEGNATFESSLKEEVVGVVKGIRPISEYVLAVIPEKEDFKFYEAIYKKETEAFAKQNEARSKRVTEKFKNARIAKKSRSTLTASGKQTVSNQLKVLIKSFAMKLIDDISLGYQNINFQANLQGLEKSELIVSYKKEAKTYLKQFKKRLLESVRTDKKLSEEKKKIAISMIRKHFKNMSALKKLTNRSIPEF